MPLKTRMVLGEDGGMLNAPARPDEPVAQTGIDVC
jgi:hypothetical protein